MVCSNCGNEITAQQEFCSQCGTKTGVVQSEIQGASNPSSLKRKSWIVKIFLLAVLAGGLYIFISTVDREYHPVIAKQPTIDAPAYTGAEKIKSYEITASLENEYIVIPVQQIIDHKIIRFSDPQGIQNIPIIAYLTPKGKIVTAMSLSEACRSTDFYLEGEDIHCANCPSYWNAESLEAYACCQKYYPDPITSDISGGNVRIKKEIVAKWQARL